MTVKRILLLVFVFLALVVMIALSIITPVNAREIREGNTMIEVTAYPGYDPLPLIYIETTEINPYPVAIFERK